MASKKTSGNAGSGSPSSGEPEYLVVGYLQRPHGVRGEMVMQIETDFPERLKPESKVFVGESRKPMVIAGSRFHNEGLLIKFSGIDSPEEAGLYRRQAVYVKSADRPALPAGEYYHHQLIGFDVVSEHDESVGTLAEIIQTGANDVFVVRRPDQTEALLPVIPSVILNVETGRRIIRVHLLPGLIEDRKS